MSGKGRGEEGRAEICGRTHGRTAPIGRRKHNDRARVR